MKRLSLLAAVGAMVAGTAGAAAMRPGPYKLSEAESKAAMRDYVACTVKATPSLASKAVVEDWGIGQLVETRAKLLSASCTKAAGLISRMSFEPTSLRSVIAERLLAIDPSLVIDKGAAAALAPLAYRQPWPVETVDRAGKPLGAEVIARRQAGYTRRLGAIAGQQIAECVIRADAGLVRPLFATKVDSAEELATLKSLSAALPGCVPANKQFSFDRQSLRGSLALAYYRMAMATRGVTWAGAPAGANGAQD